VYRSMNYRIDWVVLQLHGCVLGPIGFRGGVPPTPPAGPVTVGRDVNITLDLY